jgi:hypothetical protein
MLQDYEGKTVHHHPLTDEIQGNISQLQEKKDPSKLE